MKYYVFGYTDTGGFRDHNEDALLLNRKILTESSAEATVEAPFIAAVCDGVGGENMGDLAAKICLENLSTLQYSEATDMKRTLLNIHGKIKRKSVIIDKAKNMQTTLCCLGVDEHGKGLCINVGDSRMYRYVNGHIRQISVDQTYGQYMYEHGKIDDVDELEPKYRSAIISSLGSTSSDPDIVQTPLGTDFGFEPDDMIIICSDGVSDFVTNEEFEIGLNMDLSISEKLMAIAQLAQLNGSADNITIVGVKPYLDDDELAALTDKSHLAETVNVAAIVKGEDPKEKDELSDILDIDVEEIIGKKRPKNAVPPAPPPKKKYTPKAPEKPAAPPPPPPPPPKKKAEIKSEEDIKLEAHDLFMQAQASLSKLERLFEDE